MLRRSAAARWQSDASCRSIDNNANHGYNNNMIAKLAPDGTADASAYNGFRTGRRGDRGGRRRPTRDLAALLSAALDAPATIVEDGKRRRVTKRALIAAQLVDRSAQADLRATKLLVDLLHTIAPRALGPEFEPEPPDAVDDQVITTLLARLGLAE
jgi:hypothetical protein